MRKSMWRVKRKKWAEIARERMLILLSLAHDEALSHNFERARRYVFLARKIGMKYNVSLPRKFKRNVCKKCCSFLIPGYNAVYRLKRKKITILCKNCGRRMRVPYK